ncbi:SagB/ThcOx family dehydrogenase [Herminiimonas sp. CN]|uniref:SagB/ThcOx family dehydrogenase n=1 Tax=Herminiimonas sp. CN TaxID=1349818 RepID=UPI0004741C3E|nr:SagB/ThcOx family dehydrogenase [Herminiimonas sp. CN]
MTTPHPNASRTTLSLMPLVPVAPDPGLSALGMTFMQVLQKRKTTRDFSDREISLETLSHLLWAAFGINRPDGAHRTAPSAKNAQEIDIYVALEQGLYVFDPYAFALAPVLKDDIRAATGWQDFVRDAPVNLVYVADMKKMDPASRQERKFYAALDTGHISQNVYLFCAAEGLATVARGWVDRPALAKIMGLGPEQRIILAQSVGFPRD